MRGDRTNYGRGYEMTRLCLRLSPAEMTLLEKVRARAGLGDDVSTNDLIKQALIYAGAWAQGAESIEAIVQRFSVEREGKAPPHVKRDWLRL